MRVEKFCILVVVNVVLLLFVWQQAYSQPNYKRSYELGVTNLTLLDFTLIFTQRLKEKSYLEITNSFVYHKKDEYTAGRLFLTIKDPYELYNLYRLRVGLRYFLNNKFYVTPMFIFNVGGFNDCLIEKYIDVKGSEAQDVDYRLSRTRHDIGTIIKFGFLTSYDNHFLTDIYLGLGFKVKYFNDNITEIITWGQCVEQYDYPIQKQYVGLMPTFHFGVMIGYWR